MPHYMFQGRYTPQAIKAMVDSPQDREAAARPLFSELGGTLHHLYFCFGTDDVVAIVEMPDDEKMAAAALAVAASGALSGGATTKLLTPSEAMAAMESARTAAASYKSPID